MTAPVITEGINNEWVVSFVMPKEYSLSTLPKPNNKNITITRLPAEKYAVIVFSGLVRKSNYDEQVKLLKKFILKKNLKTIGLIQIARYNPPWTLPFFRRNELMIRIN
jgi:effector-binding domain-containing protein